ncbi:response regulator [Streptomyces barringtoniae]|uniref:response regulator n=1 Tax=Streptomyces barringtoniae TaxID=2892029 RepID=UPI001E64F004|nr:response regulator transcription factor [Streptomyces barringtoniae]MCC5476907.1 response regulator transcription factor [Streptomyces barringtoniae]
MTERIRIVLADDHQLLRGALADILHLDESFEVVAEVGDGAAAVEKARALQPDVVLLDVEMPHNDPPRTVERIIAASPRTRVIVLTMHDDDPVLIRTLVAHRISGFLHKGVSRNELVGAIREAVTSPDRVTISASREAILGVSRATDLPAAAEDDGTATSPKEGPLSVRELQVLTYVGTALSNRQIATRLDITETTVKRHLRNIFRKLGATSRLDAYNKAVAASLLTPVRASR